MDEYRQMQVSLPEVHRARDCRLYDRRGNRYLDLWRNGGRALLGHRPERVYRELKNVLQKGVVAEYPSLYPARLKKALRALIPGNWEVRIFASWDRALSVAKQLTDISPERSPVAEPFLHPGRGAGVFYRPFLKFPYQEAPIVIPILPFPGGFAPQPVLIDASLAGAQLPPDDPVSPVLAAALARTVWYLIRLERSGSSTDSLPDWGAWRLYGWERISCYGVPRFDLSRYVDVFQAFLDRKILIPPTPMEPLILPMEWSKGEKALVESTARELLGEGGLYGDI